MPLPPWGGGMFPMDLFLLLPQRKLPEAGFLSAKKKEEEERVRRNSQSQLPVIAGARTLSGLPTDGRRLLRKERFMKMKAKFYAHADTHALTHIHLAPQHLSVALRQGGHLFRKAKRGLSVHFTLGTK